MADYTLGSPPITVPVSVTGHWSLLWSPSITFPVAVLGDAAELRAVTDPVLPVPMVLGGGFGTYFGGTVEARMRLSVQFTDTIAGAVQAPAAATPATIEVPVELTARWGGTITGTVAVPMVLRQTFKLSSDIDGVANTIDVPMVLTGEPDIIDTRRSPAFAYFNGNNYLRRTAGTGGADDALNGGTTFSLAVTFDPELVDIAQDCVVVAKNNETDNQAGWKVEWVSATGVCTVTVFSALNGTNSVVRTTTVPIRTRSTLLFTYDATGAPDLQLYVNGASSQGGQTNNGTPGAMVASTEPLTIGAQNHTNGGTDHLKGAVYLVAAWDSVLSPTDVAKLENTGIIHDDLLTASLQVAWVSAGVESGFVNTNFYRWDDSVAGLTLALGSATDPVRIFAADTSAPVLTRNRWNLSFLDDDDLRPQNLNSDRVLSTTFPIRRLWNVSDVDPNISDLDDWRRQEGDLTLIVIGYKPSGSGNVVVFRSYGLELRFNVATQTLSATVGADSTLSLLNDTYTFKTSGVPGFGEGVAFNVVFRYNADEDKAVAIVNGTKYLPATIVATDSFEDGEGLVLVEQADYITAIAAPACLSDQQIQTLLDGFTPTAYSFGSGFTSPADFEVNRYVPGNVASEGLSHLTALYPPQHHVFPEPPDALVPTPFDQVPQIAQQLPSSQYSFPGPQFLGTDAPYGISEGTALEEEIPEVPIFGDPLPVILSVTVSAGHQVVATVNAGPTDAGTVLSWWEVEYVSGNLETLIQIDYNPANNFSVNHNHIDTWTIPLGLDFKDKRIRFVIVAVADAAQRWESNWFRMEGEAFDNDPPETIVIPGPETPSPPTVSDLEVILNQQALVLAKKREARRLALTVASNSRYKLARAFLDADRAKGVEFALLPVIDDFFNVDDQFRTHRIRRNDIGALDRLAVEYFGPGNEPLWWSIAYLNGIIDPEDMRAGDAILIPSRTRARQFLARRQAR